MSEDIVLVDDEAGIRKVLGISLADLGYRVHTAEDGARALAIIEAVRPSIALTDIKMPGMNGIELLKTIKARYPDTEVIMLTGHGDMDLAVESLKFQATDFITKPISDDALSIALQRAAERIGMRRQLNAYTQNLEQLVEEKSRQLVEAERMAAVGETVAGLSHTIKNIAGGLDGGMFVLEKGIDLNDTDYLKQGWDLVQGNVDRIKRLSLDLLDFAKTNRLEYREVDPGQPAREVVHLMRSRAGSHGMELVLDIAPKLPVLNMDPEGIYQCLLNLVTNAIDACLDTEPVANAPQRIVVAVSLSPDNRVCYRVTDSCCGMDEKTRKRLFQRFFTTKGERGTGIGLMLTQTIVHRHGGTIEVASRPGKGSCFTIQLPGGPEFPTAGGLGL
jgi:signal transduction histidine kinase